MEVDPVRWQRVLLMLSAVVAVILLIGGIGGRVLPAGRADHRLDEDCRRTQDREPCMRWLMAGCIRH